MADGSQCWATGHGLPPPSGRVTVKCQSPSVLTQPDGGWRCPRFTAFSASALDVCVSATEGLGAPEGERGTVAKNKKAAFQRHDEWNKGQVLSVSDCTVRAELKGGAEMSRNDQLLYTEPRFRRTRLCQVE